MSFLAGVFDEAICSIGRVNLALAEYRVKKSIALTDNAVKSFHVEKIQVSPFRKH